MKFLLLNKLTLTQVFSNKNKKFFSAILAMMLLAGKLSQAQEVLTGLTSNGGVEGRGTAYTIKTNGTGFSVIKGFADWGGFPVGDLVRGNDGNFYGMTPDGGTYTHGTLFRITPGGTITVLKHFNLAVDGGYPKGSLVLGKDGNFYGVTSNGSPNNGGSIFKITPAGVYTILRSLSVNTDGGKPQGRLIQATDGNFYGINAAGGSTGFGTIFRITPAGVYTVLKTFSGTDGATSYGGLLQASDGNFYGMTYLGGSANRGVIFKLTAAGAYSVLRHLNGTTDGQYPYGDLIQAKDGFLYGMVNSGSTVGAHGNAIKISTTGAFSVIHNFSAGVDGGYPRGRLLQAADGLLYGLTNTTSGTTQGSLFKMTTAGVTTVVKKFTLATEGGNPAGSLIQAPDGLLYGMNAQGGANGEGTIFKITTGGAITVLSHLNGATHGHAPEENLALGRDSAYYGVTRLGGTYNFGTIFKICGGVTTVLRSFNRSTDGASPLGGLLRGSDGNFYGTTEAGGSSGGGTIFKITPAGAFTVLKHLNFSTDGGNPRASLVQAADGNLYGMTNSGGTGSSGTLFKITTAGQYTVLRHFVAATDGNYPEAGLTVGKDGFLYGMTSTRFFKISTAGAFTVIKTLVYATNGSYPMGSMIQGSDGNFYGTMSQGGTNSGGTVFKITPLGVITVLRHLSPATDGKFPKSTMLQAADGNYYGTTSLGGTYGTGTIFKVTSTGTFSVLRHFNLATDGGSPTGGLIRAPKNNLVANPQSNVAVTEDVAKAIVLTGSGATGLTYSIAVAPKNGSITTGTAANRTYTPNANYTGKDSFAFTVNNGCMSSPIAWVTLNVTGVNDAPVLATIGNKTVVKGTALKFTATATDPDAGQTKTFSLVTPPAGATIVAATGAFSWTPAAAGTFTVRVKVSDNGSPVLSDEEQITITVTNPAFAALSAPAEAEFRTVTATLFPNPVVNGFTVALPKTSETVLLTVIDMKGTVLHTRKYQGMGKQQQLRVEGLQLKPGQYLLQVKTAEGSETLKFVKL